MLYDIMNVNGIVCNIVCFVICTLCDAVDNNMLIEEAKVVMRD